MGVRRTGALDLLRLALTVALCCAACVSHPQLTPEAELRAEIEAMREAVAEKVPDPQRVARLDSAIDGYEMQLLAFASQAGTFRARIEALNSRADATRPEFDTLVDEFDRQRIAARSRVLQLHSEMIAATTADEWQSIAKHERAVLTVPGEL